MTEKQKRRRAAMIKRGRSHFVWRYGVLGWGLSTAIAWAVFMELWQSGLEHFSAARLAIYLAVALLLFPVGGYLWGRCMWKWTTASKADVQ